MIFDPARFERFCRGLLVDTKEMGRQPLEWLGTQRYFVNELAAGINDDVHTFIVLKGRQAGISTVMNALDLYWPFKHPGLQGAIVTDTDENREFFRSNITQMLDSIPMGRRPKIESHNRVQLIFGKPCGSRLVYMVAGLKKKGELGRGKGVNYMHATECSSWGDEEGLGSLMNTLAQQNPHRLYVFESTARGYDMFYQMWENAKESNTQRAIFIGWWRNSLYRKEKGSKEYKAYWDGSPTPDEKVWVREVYEKYRHSITSEQLAWWRWYVAEQMKGDENLALQEQPPTEEYAFQLSGSKYFSGERVNEAYQEAVRLDATAKHYRYQFGVNFEDTELVETNEEMAELTIWEPPQDNGVYVLGADPAYGSSEWADEFAISVNRCYADRTDQVAQVHTPDWTEQQFAWVLLHLAGSYRGERGAMVCLEMQGPGGAVFNEINNLRRLIGSMTSADPRRGLFDVVGLMRDYLWKKQDSMAGGYAYQWQTNAKEKIRMMSNLRSYFERGMVGIRSRDCVQQFRNIHRQGDQIGGEGRAKDDMVIALAIAVVAWNDHIMGEMQVTNRTCAYENRPPDVQRANTPIERGVMRYLQSQGITRAR